MAGRGTAAAAAAASQVDAFLTLDGLLARYGKRSAELRALQLELEDIQRREDKAKKNQARKKAVEEVGGDVGVQDSGIRRVYAGWGGPGTALLMRQDRAALRAEVRRELDGVEKRLEELLREKQGEASNDTKRTDAQGLAF